VTDVPHTDELEELVRELKELGGAPSAAYADLRDEAEIRSLIASVIDRHGRLDVLVNNAAAPHATDKGDPEQVRTGDFDAQYSVNLRGTFMLVREAIPIMRRQRFGRIVNISSQAGRIGIADRAAYSASKAGLLGLTRSLAVNLGPDGITVNAICPGAIATDRLAETLSRETGAGGDSSEVHGHWIKSIPIRRLGTPADIGNAAVFLASDLAAYITGQELAVDGGRFAF
jgi:NAD(P)-dependent dehydrogenase (short-subunit alcohol dehydrogenase family)